MRVNNALIFLFLERYAREAALASCQPLQIGFGIQSYVVVLLTKHYAARFVPVRWV